MGNSATYLPIASFILAACCISRVRYSITKCVRLGYLIATESPIT